MFLKKSLISVFSEENIISLSEMNTVFTVYRLYTLYVTVYVCVCYFKM